MVHVVMIHVAMRPIARQHRDDLHHARMHVVKQMTMESPVADMVSRDVDRQFLARLDDDSVLARFVGAAPVHQIEEHAMQMNGVVHHGLQELVHLVMEITELVLQDHCQLLLKQEEILQ